MKQCFDKRAPPRNRYTPRWRPPITMFTLFQSLLKENSQIKDGNLPTLETGLRGLKAVFLHSDVVWVRVPFVVVDAGRHAVANGLCLCFLCCNNRRPCRLCWRRRESCRVPRTGVSTGPAGSASAAVPPPPPPPPPPPRAPVVSCRGSCLGEGSLGRARLQPVLTGTRAARASDDRVFCYCRSNKKRYCERSAPLSCQGDWGWGVRKRRSDANKTNKNFPLGRGFSLVWRGGREGLDATSLKRKVSPREVRLREVSVALEAAARGGGSQAG